MRIVNDLFKWLVTKLPNNTLPAFYFFILSGLKSLETQRLLKTYRLAHKPDQTKKQNFRYLQAAARP